MLDPDAAPPVSEAKARTKSRAKVSEDRLPPVPSKPEHTNKRKPPGHGGGRLVGDRKLKDEDVPRVLEALRQTNGIKDPAARLLRVSGKTFRKFLSEHPEVDEEIREITEDLVDACESTLVKAALKREDIRALQLILAVKGKDRGWNQRYEVTGANGAPLLSPAPSPADLIEALEAVLAKRGEQAALRAPAGVPLLELSAEPAPAESGPGADPASDPTEDAG